MLLPSRDARGEVALVTGLLIGVEGRTAGEMGLGVGICEGAAFPLTRAATVDCTGVAEMGLSDAATGTSGSDTFSFAGVGRGGDNARRSASSSRSVIIGRL